MTRAGLHPHNRMKLMRLFTAWYPSPLPGYLFPVGAGGCSSFTGVRAGRDQLRGRFEAGGIQALLPPVAQSLLLRYTATENVTDVTLMFDVEALMWMGDGSMHHGGDIVPFMRGVVPMRLQDALFCSLHVCMPLKTGGKT